MSSPFASLIRRVQSTATTQTVEIAYATHDRWPLSRNPDDPIPNNRPVRISVLDSSFNPPTLAHFALATAPLPKHDGGEHTGRTEGYDGQMLLLSVRNADKSLKPGDATFVQRLDLMVRLAKAIESRPSSSPGGVAVACIDEPIFAQKAPKLNASLSERLRSFAISTSSHSIPSIQFDFLVGYDTLERLFAERYYASHDHMLKTLRIFLSPQEQNSRIISAYRANADNDSLEKLSGIQEFLGTKRVLTIDIGQWESSLSSTEVRRLVGESDQRWTSMVPEGVKEYIQENGLYAVHDS
ncbi:Nucleotidylyl transferase [Sistotremastrum suecicum HHB10207 ss-3]|uniref:Nucleotidylyl transferase n=1 Tax=Sistotremastrum suecicum HHB10207 ss-3 TaxID=1314776 RepID=A0A166GNQ3_9AGAM|nr:Nucleotidylyl transferase [Sistotremastrum suecicum HHB10207 ss-3]